MKMSKEKFLGILAILLVILLVLVGVVYSKTDLLKSPKTLFYEYISQNMDMYPKVDYNQTLEEIKKMNEKDYTVAGDIQIKVIGEEQMVQALKGLEELKMDYKTVKSKQDVEAEINIMYADKNIAKINTKSEANNKFGIKIDGIYDKYIGIENKNLKDLAKKFGEDAEEIPNELEKVDLYDLLYISNEDVKTIKETYSNILEEVIAKEKYVANKNVEVTVNEQVIKANAYSIKLNEKEVIELEKKFLETLKNDDLVLSLIESKVNKINKDNKITKEKLQKEIDKKINESNIDLKDAKEQNETEVIVYESKGQTVKTEVKEYKNQKEKEKFEIDLKRDNNKITAKVVETSNNKKVSEVTITKDETLSENANNLEYDIDIDEEGTKAKAKIQLTKNGDNENITITIGAEELEISFIINSKIDYTSQATVEKMNDENAVIINDKTDEELAKLIEELTTNAQKFVIEKAKIFGIDRNILNGFGMTPVDGIDEDKDAEAYMELMQKYQNGEITEEQLNQELNALGL